MREIEVSSVLRHFADFPDPRKRRGLRHKLLDIICISVLAVICRANTFAEIEQYGKAKEAWLRQFLDLPHGIPSVDTFERVFALMRPGVWGRWFRGWAEGVVRPDLAEGEQEVLAIDGKTSRRSYGNGFRVLHTVSVWSSQYELVIAQEQVEEKSNEIVAIPELLESINAAGAVVTTDAMGCQKNIAWLIRDQDADYVLALKDNHPKLFEDTRWLFTHADSCGWEDIPHSYAKTYAQGHGRTETRECWVLGDLDILPSLRSAKIRHPSLRSAKIRLDKAAWKDLHAVARLRCTRSKDNQTGQEEDRFYLTSLSPTAGAEAVMRAARLHWGIENGLHWTLDTAFKDDLNRARRGNAQANLVAVRHLALNVLKLDKSIKAGIETKRARASWDDAYLLKLIGL